MPFYEYFTVIIVGASHAARSVQQRLIFDTQTIEQLCQLKVDEAVLCLSYSPTEDRIDAGARDQLGSIHFFNTKGAARRL